MKRILFYCVTALLLSTMAQANTIYVTDSLQLKLRASADTNGDIVTTLHSGQKLTLLEQQSKFSKVKTNDGQTGWVQTWFLTDEPPATYIVNQVTKEKENLETKLTSANEKLKNFDSATARENKSLKNSVESLSKKINQLSEERNDLSNKLEAQTSELAKYRFAEQYDLRVIVIGFFLLSFALGVWATRVWTRQQERKRLSGYRLAH